VRERDGSVRNDINQERAMTEETTVTVTETAKISDAKHEAVEQIVDSAIGLGRLWARHGLTLGKLALETSAATLGTTARLLGGVADAFAPDADRAETTEKA
jgi:hypothetical protein